MSTHNIGFYEDKKNFELSSNIIKYAPYFFCWNILYIMITHPFYLYPSHPFLDSKTRVYMGIHYFSPFLL